jgi:hypothetical protein
MIRKAFQALAVHTPPVFGPGTWGHFARAECRALGVRVTRRRVLAWLTQMLFEDTACAYNPQATTQAYNGSDRCGTNTANVQAYRSEADGVHATAETWRNGFYPVVLARVRANDPAAAIIRAISDSPWGSHPTLSELAYVERHFVETGRRRLGTAH